MKAIRFIIFIFTSVILLQACSPHAKPHPKITSTYVHTHHGQYHWGNHVHIDKSNHHRGYHRKKCNCKCNKKTHTHQYSRGRKKSHRH